MEIIKGSDQVLAMIVHVFKYPLFLAVMSGTFFGVWPFLQKEAGLQGINSPTAFVLIQGTLLLIFCLIVWIVEGAKTVTIINTSFIILAVGLYAHHKWGFTPKWNMLLGASILSGLGLVALSQMMVMATNQTRSIYLATVFGMQVVVAMLIHLYLNPNDFGSIKVVGFLSIGGGMFLIHMK